jgi:hypothetical protein
MRPCLIFLPPGLVIYSLLPAQEGLTSHKPHEHPLAAVLNKPGFTPHS